MVFKYEKIRNQYQGEFFLLRFIPTAFLWEQVFAPVKSVAPEILIYMLVLN